MKTIAKRCKKRKRGKSWYFTIFYINSACDYFTKRCSDQEAERIYQRILDRIAAGTFEIKDFTVPAIQKITLVNFFVEYLEYRENKYKLNDIKENTLVADGQASKIFVKTIGPQIYLDEVDESIIDKFKLTLLHESVTVRKDHYKPGAINNYLKHLNIAFSYAVKKGYISANPIASTTRMKPELKKRDQVLTREEILQIREYFTTRQPWEMDAFNFALWSGCRLESIAKVKYTDLQKVEYQDHSYYILKLIEKGDKIRHVPVNKNLLELVHKRIAWINSPELINKLASRENKHIALDHEIVEDYIERARQGYLFFEISYRGTFSKAFAKACKKVNIEGITFHSLRHTFATYTHNAGIDIKYVQDLLGHSDIKTTMIYVNPALQMLINGYLDHAPEL